MTLTMLNGMLQQQLPSKAGMFVVMRECVESWDVYSYAGVCRQHHLLLLMLLKKAALC